MRILSFFAILLLSTLKLFPYLVCVACFSCLWCAPLSLLAQLTGRVVDEQGQAIEAANVLLLRLPDSALVKGQVTDTQGYFTLQDFAEGRYAVQVRMIGFAPYHTASIDWEGGGSRYSMGELALSEQALAVGEVEIVAERQLYEQKIDRLVVNVSNSITAAGNTALEVLERAPGVIMNRGNNSLSLAGKEGVVVMINGKRNFMPIQGVLQMLAGMSASEIEKIELITTPPADFDAEGNAGYINILLKENANYGFNGSFNSSVGYGRGLLTNQGLSFNYRRPKLNLYGSYAFLLDDRPQLFTNFRAFEEEGERIEFDTESNRQPQQLNHNFRLGLDYQLTPKTLLGVLASSYDTKWTMDAFNHARFSYANRPDTLIELQTVELNQWRHYMGNVNVQHQFTPTTSLTVNADYLFYRDNNPTDYQNTYLRPDRSFVREEQVRSEKVTPIQIGVGALDFKTQLGEKGQFQAGLKGTVTRFTNDVAVSFLRAEWMTDPALTGTYFLEEEIGAAYAALDYQLDPQTSLKAGLRYEYTNSNLSALDQPDLVDRQYGNLFPSFFLSRKLGENQQLNLSYSRRITRPTFNDMAPFVIFIDPQTFFSGNAALQPAIADAVKLDYRIKTLMLSLSYTYEDSSILAFQTRLEPETGRQVINAENAKGIHTLNLNASLPLTLTDWWEMQVNLSGSWNQINTYLSEELLSFEQWTLNLSGAQRFKLPWQMGLEVSGFYNSPSQWGTLYMEGYGGLNAGLRKQFGTNGSKGSLSFNVQDIFNSVELRFGTDLPAYNLVGNSLIDFSQRTFVLAFTYPFGSSKVRAARQRDTASEEERQRVK
jgi:outer membrane receptor protein involved in Fe transport